MKNRQTDKQLIKNIAITIIIFIIVESLLYGGLLSRQFRSLLIPVCINVILAVSLNLTTGFLGELTLGHAGFMSVGAYTGALVTLNMNLPMAIEFPVALFAGGIAAAIFGVIIGVPVLRLRGDYLAIVTLAFGEIIKSIINSMKITNGAMGLSGIELHANYKHFAYVFALTVITIFAIKNMVHSRQGRAVCAIRDNYIAAEAVGISVSRFKVMAFVVAAFFAGIAGVIYSHNVGTLKPTTFDYNKSIEILVIVVLGGMGSIRGSVIAAIILTVLPELLRSADEFRMLLYAIVLIVMMIFNSSQIKQRILSSEILSRLRRVKKEA
ncbi:amino acid/amide ABC transporter membrane protein 2 (HAAT family) [Lachnotalea glycerini]|jgi:branched-chain amino acid transport system permease protein|uniref:Amino acid/amide ABC transporter membrane protein 2 (HAAT family) n=1 Tax=Lachnotalea glycerini TaxID=1763509 RepID=A0A318EJ74_9FIRM|nr:branched-chain amino acid ABC transporter permease [Lachnotalea glycerini]PXV87738.1 amino acid/amide ABC transporter membrane protein 2 (HAAT family) [Lachnotalea glycerini]